MPHSNIFTLLQAEETRQKSTLSLIASENITSKNVRLAMNSVLTNKYAEGYPGNRYYAGCEIADQIETKCIELAKQAFNAAWANVQPHSGSQANAAVYFALLNPGDTILSLGLESGGHLTHGAKVSSTNKFYKIINYHIQQNGFIDMSQVESLANEHKPKLIITGASAYSQAWSWQEFATIAKNCGAYLMADVAHIAGLIVGKAHDNPIDYADVITTTNHKTLRGPRGGMILSRNAELGKKLDRAVFPGIQGGPLMNIIAAKAIALQECLQPEFQNYAQKIIENAQILAKTLQTHESEILSGGTVNHLMIASMLPFGLSGKEAVELLNQAGVTTSASALPGESWLNPSCVRFGTPYATTLGIDMPQLSELLVQTLQTKNIMPLKNFIESTVEPLYQKFL